MKCTPSRANVVNCTTHNVRERHFIQTTTILPQKNLPLRLREQNLVERQKQYYETIPLEQIQDRLRQG